MSPTPLRSSLALLALFAAGTATLLRAQSTHPLRVPVLVELFTSEGCSSCPPADALLAQLLQQQPVPGADIIVLEEHVDYWDSLGWHDRFSARQFTDRQNGYTQAMHLDSGYTPQMVVDGADQFVGNDSARALRAITHAALAPKLALSLTPLLLDGNQITGSVATGGTSVLPRADLFAVIIDQMASTAVARGENGGRTLHHVSIVRSMQRVGSLDALAKGPLSFDLALPQNSTAATSRVILFAQRPGQGTVLAAASAAITQTTPQQAAAF